MTGYFRTLNFMLLNYLLLRESLIIILQNCNDCIKIMSLFVYNLALFGGNHQGTGCAGLIKQFDP